MRATSPLLTLYLLVSTAPVHAQFNDALRAAGGITPEVKTSSQVRNKPAGKTGINEPVTYPAPDLLYPKAPPIPPMPDIENNQDSDNGPPANCNMGQQQWEAYCGPIPHPSKWRIQPKTGIFYVMAADNPSQVGKPIADANAWSNSTGSLEGGRGTAATNEIRAYDVDSLVSTPRWQLCRYMRTMGTMAIAIPGMTQTTTKSSMNAYLVNTCQGYKK